MRWLRRILKSSKAPPLRRAVGRRLCMEELEDRVTPSILLPTAGRDLVYDFTRQLLYLVNDTRIERYDPAGGTVFPPYQLATTLTAADITPDGSALYVTAAPLNPTTGVVYRVNLASGNIANLTYPLTPTETAGGKIAVANNGRAFFAGYVITPNPAPLRQIDLTSGAISLRSDAPVPTFINNLTRSTHIYRSADYSQLVIGQSQVTTLPNFFNALFTYSPASDNFSPLSLTKNHSENSLIAVERTGARIATAMQRPSAAAVVDRNFNGVENLGAIGSGGVAFDPMRNLLYAVDAAADQVVALDTGTWQERFRLAVGEDVGAPRLFGPGTMTVSSDGRFLFLITPTGVRRIDLPASPGVAVRFEVTDFPRFTRQGLAHPFTVRVLDSLGNPVPGYTGTVRFSSTDSGASLPADYTFTTADAGVKTFTAAFAAPATHTLTAQDPAAPALTGSQGGIVVHNGQPSLVPLLGAINFLHDPARGMLYAPVANGRVERYDFARQTLLPPWQVGRNLGQADLTLDGRFLIVTEITSGLLQGAVRRIDLDSGQFVTLFHGSPQTLPALVIPSHGKVLLGGNDPEGLPFVHELNLISGALVPRFAVAPSLTMNRSADRTTVLLQYLIGNPFTMTVYDAATDGFARTALPPFHVARIRPPALSRDGAAIYSDRLLVERNLNQYIALFPQPSGHPGLAFNPVRDLAYHIDTLSDQIVALNTRGGVEVHRISNTAGMPAFNSTTLAEITSDGQLLVLSFPQGMHLISLPMNPGVPATLEVAGYPRYARQGTSNSFTVRVLDNLLNPVANYSGTVRFSIDSGSAQLPGDYTFTPTDGGVRTFSATFNSTGGFRLTARDVAQPTLAGTQYDIGIHNDQIPHISILFGPRELIADPARGLLYIIADYGKVERYDLARRTLLAPFDVGFQPGGSDLSLDGNFLYISQHYRNLTSGFIRRLNLNDGSVTTLVIPLQPQETFINELSIAANGKALLTANATLGFIPPIRELNLSTGAVIPRPTTHPVVHIERSADRGQLLFWSYAAGGTPLLPILTYESASDSFPRSAVSRTTSSLTPTGQNAFPLGSVSRDGQLLAIESVNGIAVVDRNLTPIRFLDGLEGGLVFDPLRSMLYTINTTTDQVIAFDSNTWTERFRLTIGLDATVSIPFTNGAMAVSSDGRFLALMMNPTSVRILELPAISSGMSGFEVKGFPRFTGQSATHNVTVRAVNGLGETVTNYTGTVQFSAGGTGAVLPAAYTFTPADQGVKAFAVQFTTPGARTITVRDAAQPGVTGAQAGITVHNGQVSTIPVSERRDLIYDPVRDILYILTGGRKVERYHVTSQTLLPPIELTIGQTAGDISPDGNFLYVAISQPLVLHGRIQRVNLTTGAVTQLGEFDLDLVQDLTYLLPARILFSIPNSLRLMHQITGEQIERRAVEGTLRMERSADRSRAFITSDGFFSHSIFTYDPAQEIFPATLSVDGSFPWPVINQTGSLVAHRVLSGLRIRDANLNLVREFAPLDGGAVFDSSRNLLYAVDSNANQIVVRNTVTWNELTRFAVGEDVSQSGVGFSGIMTLNSDGRLLFLNASSGVRSFWVGDTLKITQLVTGNSGFTVRFNRPLDLISLNLYDSQFGGLGPADVTLVGNSTGPVSGSLLVGPAGDELTFLRTSGPLPPDFYVLGLRSAANGIRDPFGNMLDGNGDGVAGDGYFQTVTVAPTSAVFVSVPDFMRGPDQPVNLPANSTGLPLRLSSSAGVRSVLLTLNYDPALLTIAAASVAPGLPVGATVVLTPGAPGSVTVQFNSSAPLPGGVSDFVRLTAFVPAGAGYTRKQKLDVSGVQINDGLMLARDDDGVQVLGYLGDTNGNGSYSSLDAARALRVAVGLDGGFDAWQLADPLLIADVTGNGILNSTDALRILQQALGIDQDLIPPLPPNPPTIVTGGPDPVLQFPRKLRGRPGELVRVPLQLDRSAGLESADLAIAYDTSRLEVVAVRRGRLTQDFNLFAVNLDRESGTITVGLGRNEGPISDRGSGSVLEIVFRVRRDATAGEAMVNLMQGLGTTRTQLNEGGLDLIPDPSNEAGDELDGSVMVGQSKRRIDAFFRQLG